MDNLIQVYGLRRSGTNFIEWSLVNNFSNVNYKNVRKSCNVPGSDYGSNIALKHSFPSLKHSKFAIVIFKEYEEWTKSILRAYDQSKILSRKDYNTYLKKAKDLDQDRTIIIEHRDALENYVSLLNNIQDKFNITLNSNIKFPTKRLNRSGAKASMTSKHYYSFNDNSNT